MNAGVLVVEDDPRVARLVERALVESSYRVTLASDSLEARQRLRSAAPSAIVLDVMLPGEDGLSFCRSLRQEGVRTPVLMLTARDAVSDRVRGLDAGADDYLPKPFALEELLARLRALTRRAIAPDSASQHELLTVADLTLDVTSHEATRGDRPIELTQKEFQLLAYLLRNAGRVLTRSQILDQVWGYDSASASNVVDIYIHYLRDKVDQNADRPLIRTIRGVGYTLKP